MNKKFLTVGLAGVLAVTAVVGGSLAYFTDTDKKDNAFTVGNVDITLTEPQWDEIGSKEAENAYPGEALAKDPTVTNDGANPCFVRIQVTGLDQFDTKGDITYRTYDEDTEEYIEGLGDGWSKGTDGYFYYDTVLDTGDATDALFDQIVMPTGLTGEETNIKPIVVTAQAVQAQGAAETEADVADMTVEEIAAWFTKCGMTDPTAAE